MVASAAPNQFAHSSPGDATVGGQGTAPSCCPLPSSPSLSHSVTESLLDHLASPNHSLASVAEKHNLTLSALLAWLEHPAIREQMALRESVAYRHVRYVGALNLSHAVHTTVKTLEAFNATPCPADPLDPGYLRAAIHARKAAWLLYRFSRLTSIAEPDLAAARVTLRATQSVSRAVEGAQTHVPAHTPAPEPLPTPPAQATPERAPQPTPSASAPSHTTDSAPVAPVTSIDSADLTALVAQLTDLATSLGIDTSDIDNLPDDAPIPPEILAMLPPDVVAYLTEPDPPPEHTHDEPVLIPEPQSASP
jgi:hypothetical protein